ncbi:DUF6233 domain-containing protein [Streptomyces sp. NPDC002566]|uniref:DUF6233 domain-containing protein n=1 Tax=Streptomyces sp. NPDC002566 TaxID=3364650 RepID=UPI0036C3F334
MTESRPPTCLKRLRIVRGFLQHQIAQVDDWIAEEERKAAERRRGIEARPPAPDWLVELSPGGRHPVQVHAGGCPPAGKRPRGVNREEALRRLAEGVPACGHCRPDTELGFLNG